MARTMAGLAAGVLPQNQRRLRHPQHPFHVRHAPYEIQPFLIAPVLPGESLAGLSFQARVLTKALKAQLVGGWIEYYFFYVKHRDLNSSSTFTDMMLNADHDITGHEDYQSGTRDLFYYWASKATTTMTGMNWLKACTRKVIETWFRDEGEAWNAVTIDGNPAAYINQNGWFHSAMLLSEDEAVDVDVDVNATPEPDTVSTRDIYNALAQYEWLRQNNLTNATYEDFLRSYGVRIQVEDEFKPELIRYVRQWNYPTSAVIPDSVTAGEADVTASLAWSIAERADKRRFFREPGFVVGYSVMRPKVYMANQNGYAASLLDNHLMWLPAVLRDDASHSWKTVADAATDMINGNASANWMVDVRDLYLYGDQYTNQDLSAATDMSKMALPDTSVGTKAPVQASVDALFVDGDATGGVKQDGIVQLHIAGAVEDLSPRGSAMGAAL